jgi:hypothetical protein
MTARLRWMPQVGLKLEPGNGKQIARLGEMIKVVDCPSHSQPRPG